MLDIIGAEKRAAQVVARIDDILKGGNGLSILFYKHTPPIE